MSLTLIEKKLGQLRGHIRLMFFSWGLAKITMWAAGLTLWLYYTDRLLELPGGMRIVFLLIALGVLGVVAVRSLIYPLSRTLTDEDLALLVEREYPLLNDRLISSLQILKSQERYKDAASEDMMKAVVGESFDIAGRLQFNDAVRSRRLLYMVLGSLLAMGLVFGHAWLDRDAMSTWVKRAFGQGPEWPKDTQLDVEILAEDRLSQYPSEEPLTVNFTFNPEAEVPELGVTGVYEVAANSDLRIIARPSGEIPDEAEIVIRAYQHDPETGEFVRIGKEITRPMERATITGGEEESVYFTYNKMSIINPLEQIEIRAGDATAGPYTIRTIPAPELDSPLELTLTYPEYLVIPEKTTQELPIDAVAGTQVEFRFSTTKPLMLEGRNASRLSVDYNVGSTQTYPINTDREAGENHYRARIPALQKAMQRYRLTLVDEKGIENTRSIGDVLKVKEDTAPVVRIVFSGDPLVSNQLVYVTRDAILPIEFEMVDDYGVGSAKLFWRQKIDNEFIEYKKFAEQFRYLSEDPQPNVGALFTLDFARLLADTRIPQGSRPAIEVYIQAFDLNQQKVDDTSDPTFQGSRHHTTMTYELYDIDELRAKVSSRIRQTKTSINSMLSKQEELLATTRDALSQHDKLDFSGEEGERLRNDLNEAYKGQNQQLRDAEVVLREFGVFAQVYQYNRLEREDLDKPQESRIQNVRMLLAIASADRELQQNINSPMSRLEDAEQDLSFRATEIIAALSNELVRALPGGSFSADSFGKLLQDTQLYSPGCLDRSRGLYESLLEVGIKPNERREMLVELEKQQKMIIDTIETIQVQVKKWEGFDDILNGFRNLKDTQNDTNKEIEKEIRR